MPQYFDYDRYGNLVSSARAVNHLVSYTYDLADRLVNQHLPGGGNDDFGFVLDALGRPLQRTREGGGPDVYAYVGLGETAWFNDPAATNAVSSAIGPDESRLAVKDGSSFAWLLPDLHGSIAAGVNSAETAVTDGWRYDGYGRTVSGSSTSALNPWKYQGRLDISPDSANPLYDAGARFSSCHSCRVPAGDAVTLRMEPVGRTSATG